MYSFGDFRELNDLPEKEIKKRIVQAHSDLEEQEAYFKQYEEEEGNIDLDILFHSIKNIEGYIRKAENLLEVWDDYRYLNKIRKERLCIKAVNVKVIKPIKIKII